MVEIPKTTLDGWLNLLWCKSAVCLLTYRLPGLFVNHRFHFYSIPASDLVPESSPRDSLTTTSLQPDNAFWYIPTETVIMATPTVSYKHEIEDAFQSSMQKDAELVAPPSSP